MPEKKKNTSLSYSPPKGAKIVNSGSLEGVQKIVLTYFSVHVSICDNILLLFKYWETHKSAVTAVNVID